MNSTGYVNRAMWTFYALSVMPSLRNQPNIFQPTNKLESSGLRNELNNLRCQFDEVCRKNLASETLIASIVNRSNELRSEVSSCQYMIDAIYRYICQRRKIPQADYSLTDVKPKIDVLKSTLGVWSQILSSSELMKRKKSLKTYRKSYAGKASAVQGIYMWKKKISRAGLS